MNTYVFSTADNSQYLSIQRELDIELSDANGKLRSYFLLMGTNSIDFFSSMGTLNYQSLYCELGIISKAHKLHSKPHSWRVRSFSEVK